jgi:hypothetical protein
MTIDYLILLSYGTAIIFLMILAAGISVVTFLRRIRLEKQQILATSHPQAIRQKLYMVHSPMDDIQRWNSAEKPKALRETATITQIPTETPTTVPVRYQQTLLYGDAISDPNNEIETKPERRPYQPAIPRSL